MFNYYVGLAVRSLKRNIVLTVLMIAAIGVGIGASMTTLTVFRAMDRDPIPQKSRQLFAVQIDNWGPNSGGVVTGDAGRCHLRVRQIEAMHVAYLRQGLDSRIGDFRVAEVNRRPLQTNQVDQALVADKGSAQIEPRTG